jgi:galactokinase
VTGAHSGVPPNGGSGTIAMIDDETGSAIFRRAFQRAPSARIDAPGRAVLIGDHIDYADLSVLPMAIDRRITLWMRERRDSTIRIASTDLSFAPRQFEASTDGQPFAAGDWGNYAMAAIRALSADTKRPAGMDALIASSIPPAAGLSSSSALVVACALAFQKANGLDIPPLELASRMARAERFTGTSGGGMDQAICISGQAGHAARIDFSPLRVTPVPVPSDWRFIVANSLEPARKGGAAREAYNDRVRQCRQAFATLHGLDAHAPASIRSMIESAGAAELIERAQRLPSVLLRRLRHVASESARVHTGVVAMRARDGAAFGSLMSESHASLRDDYEVSTPALDRLVDLACDAGALGARLSGAGFGGCIVALVGASDCESVLEWIGESFYRRSGVMPGPDMLFVASPAEGARTVPFDD